MGKGPGRGSPEPQKRHYCTKHNLEAKVTSFTFKRMIRFVCDEGCVLRKIETVIR